MSPNNTSELPRYVFEGSGAPEAQLRGSNAILVSAENLSAILTCYGARTDEETLNRITARQNPYGQKRGGLGYGGFFKVKPVDDSPDALRATVRSGIVNVNLYARRQAEESPVSLELLDPAARFLRFTVGGRTVGTGSIPPVPGWLGKTLSDGTPVAQIVQVHGPNLVSIWGRNRCTLFDEGTACSFCMFDGGGNNASRTMDQVIEAIQVMRSTETPGDTNRHNNLTLTTGMLLPEDMDPLVADIARFKSTFPGFRLALETTPMAGPERSYLADLKQAGLDTLMIPLDCASPKAQEEHLPGKAALLQRDYWDCVDSATKVFAANNVTSSLLVGLEPLEVTVEAMRQMANRGVVPEPLPVRWNDSRWMAESPRPLTKPRDLILVRQKLEEILKTMEAGGPLAGCASCGGCTGIRKK
ncbi:MAG: radical SAM protein [Candidatus Gracilibacteria bacterium]|jgi:hypothetical protein